MSRSQLNYVNDSTVGKRQVIGLLGLNNKVFEKVTQMDFEDITLGAYAAIPPVIWDGSADLLGLGNNSEVYYYTLTVVSSSDVYLYTATDEQGSGAAQFDDITIPLVAPTTNVASFDPNTGKLELTAAGVTALGTNYLFASYKYVIAKSGWEIERRLVEDAQYIFQSGVGAHQSHAIGIPGTTDNGNFELDRGGRLTDGTAARTGDIFIVRNGLEEYNFISFGANLDMYALDSGGNKYWKEINPIVESEDLNMKYVKDASLYTEDTDELTVDHVDAPANPQNIIVNEVLTVNKYQANPPYTMYVVQPGLNVVLPIASNTATTITIATGFVPPVSLNGSTIYIANKKSGSFTLQNSIF